MIEIITSEILNTVLNTNQAKALSLHSHAGAGGKYNELKYSFHDCDMDLDYSINLDTLVAMCEKWIVGKGYHITMEIEKRFITTVVEAPNMTSFIKSTEERNTAILIATQWVINEEKK